MPKGLVKRTVDVQMLEEGDLVFGLDVRKCPNCKRPGAILWETLDSRGYVHIFERVSTTLYYTRACTVKKANFGKGAYRSDDREEVDPHDGRRKLTVRQRINVEAHYRTDPESGKTLYKEGPQGWDIVLQTEYGREIERVPLPGHKVADRYRELHADMIEMYNNEGTLKDVARFRWGFPEPDDDDQE